jgi:disulfide oxidoreductase YuzD
MKITAVEWLEEQLRNILSSKLTYGEIIEHAKEIEKQQIIDAYKNGKYESDKIVMSDRFYAEQYYNETFKNK